MGLGGWTPALISWFCFCNDPKNGYILSSKLPPRCVFLQKVCNFAMCPTYIPSLGNLTELHRGGDTQRVLPGRRIFFVRKRLKSASSSQITSVPSQETGESPSFMQEVSSPERSTFVQFTYSDLCQKFYSAATASNLSHIVL